MPSSHWSTMPKKWAHMKTFEKIYKTTVEPMLMYAIETWYPSQVVLQNTIERVQKFAAKLYINYFTSWHCSRKYNGSPSTKRRTRRTGYELELIIPASTLEVVTSSSLNTAKKIWNNLLADVAMIADPIRFKNTVKGQKPCCFHRWNTGIENLEL
uniref:Transposase n=1 Tax=Acrobeloides nanus TaxID=290746 RepID=A0A914C4D1_9BILA